MTVGNALILEPQPSQAGILILHACNLPQSRSAHNFDG